jgi:eukaryotic-like serine/threonine-protein kinase
MKECPECSRIYADTNRFCTIDGKKLVEMTQNSVKIVEQSGQSIIPPPAEPLPMRLTIVDQSDEGHRSRIIQGVVLDTGEQGLRIKTGTIETGQLNIVRDHTVAFKNKLELDIDLPQKSIHITGFAAWYKPTGDGINWTVGVYIRDMTAEDRRVYDDYLKTLSSASENRQVSSNS